MDGAFVCRQIPGAAFLFLDEISPTDCRFHRHEKTRLTFLYHGCIEEIDEQEDTVECTAVSLHTTPAGALHAHSFKSQRVTTLCFDLEAPLIEWIGEGMQVFDRPITAFDASIVGLARRFRHEVLTFDSGAEMVLQGLILELAGELSRRQLTSRAGSPPTWLRLAKEILDDGWNQRLSLDQVATVVGVHPSHLNRTFRSFFGMTPGDYLRTIRMDRATKAVLRTPMPLKEVASLAGYSDQAHFTREFRRRHGVTPAKFRQSAGSTIELQPPSAA